MVRSFFEIAHWCGSTPWLPPGGSCQKSALQSRFLTDEGSGREPDGLYLYQAYCESILHASPHPALWATFPPGEG